MSKEFELSPEEELALDQELNALNEDLEAIPEGWTHIAIAVPQTFAELFWTTLKAYKTIAETDKNFPAFEAMVMEAFNSLPSDIREGIAQLK